MPSKKMKIIFGQKQKKTNEKIKCVKFGEMACSQKKVKIIFCEKQKKNKCED